MDESVNLREYILVAELRVWVVDAVLVILHGNLGKLLLGRAVPIKGNRRSSQQLIIIKIKEEENERKVLAQGNSSENPRKREFTRLWQGFRLLRHNILLHVLKAGIAEELRGHGRGGNAAGFHHDTHMLVHGIGAILKLRKKERKKKVGEREHFFMKKKDRAFWWREEEFIPLITIFP